MSAAANGRPLSQTRNRIPITQNEPRMLDLLRAKSALYDAAQRLYGWQFVVVVVVPIMLAVLKVIELASAAIVAALSIAIFLADWLWFETMQKSHRTDAAKMQEVFDTEVLNLPYRSDRVGAKPDAETVAEWARRHPSAAKLRDWYGVAVGRLPMSLARIACQRSNGRWNSRMRRRYAVRLWIAAGIVVALVLAMAMLASLATLEAAFWLATALPIVNWLVREGRKQWDSAAASAKIVDDARKLWEKLLNGTATEPEVAQESRELQNDIFNQRKRDQQVFRWAYHRYRDEDEEAMKVGVEALVDEYERARRTADAPPPTALPEAS